jgi:hypothetical protein
MGRLGGRGSANLGGFAVQREGNSGLSPLFARGNPCPGSAERHLVLQCVRDMMTQRVIVTVRCPVYRFEKL